LAGSNSININNSNSNNNNNINNEATSRSSIATITPQPTPVQQHRNLTVADPNFARASAVFNLQPLLKHQNSATPHLGTQIVSEVTSSPMSRQKSVGFGNNQIRASV
jgi:hypothetical protein